MKKTEEKIIAYKGFDKDLKCQDFQYEVGKIYTIEDENIEVCERGFHACPCPIDVFKYYPPATSRYCRVEQGGNLDKSESDKVCSSQIKIGAEIGIPGIIKATFDYVRSHCTNENNAEVGKAATAGYRGAAIAGDSGAATAGYRGAAIAGYKGAATAGYRGAATAGDRGAATAGDRGTATAGSYGAATVGFRGAAITGDSGAATAGSYGAAIAGSYGAVTAGYKGAATAGYYGTATSRGTSAVGENGLAVARGNNVKVKGGLGAFLVIAEEFDDDYGIKEWKTVIVDGEKVKADTWYTLKDGELVEVEKSN